MSTRSFAPAALLVTFLAAAVGACGDNPQAPTGTELSGEPGAAAASAAVYTVKDLGTLGGPEAAARAINNRGGVVGWSTLANGRVHAFLWRAGTMRDLGALAGGSSEALAVNDDDVVVGWSTLANGAQRAVRWQQGRKLNLGSLGGRNSVATAVNASGAIVGWSEIANGETHAFIWQNGVMRDLGTLGGRNSRANGINRAGKVVGSSGTASGESHAFTWKDGVFKDLGTNGRQYATATAINTKGQIAGILGPRLDAVGEEEDATDVFLFYRDVWRSFGTAPLATAKSEAINSGGVIVGWSWDPRDELFRNRAWVYSGGTGTQNLPPLAPTRTSQTWAYGINDFGTIVGSSLTLTNGFSGPSHAVLWRRQ